MNTDGIIVTVVLGTMIIIFGVYLTACLGMFRYKSEQEQKEYEKWLEREGTKKAITSTLVLLFLFAVLVYVIINFRE
jgi:uncharacterized membrane protein YidH (DUF202 family)